MHSHISNNIHWRSGVLLKDHSSETTALVETDTESKRLQLKITGPEKREYLIILRFVLTNIHNSFSHISVTEKIGLPDNSNISVNYDYLITLAEQGQSKYIPPENPKKSYNIQDLLGIVAAPANETEIMQKLISLLKTQGIKEEKDLLNHVDDVLKVEPSLFGIKLDVNALVKKFW
jgi:internalin A